MKRTILMIHGWDYENYTSRGCKDAWGNRDKFVHELSNFFNVIKVNLPGFGGVPEPHEKMWNLSAYAKYINMIVANKKPDIILGYSFGGAIATRFKSMYHGSQSIILISPALIRNQVIRNFPTTPNWIDPIRTFIRDLYLVYVIKNPEMKYGTPFLRKTYQSIVREQLIDEINGLDSHDFILIYGEKDNMVNPNDVINKLNSSFKEKVWFIKDGGHDIANTHTGELIKIISSN